MKGGKLVVSLPTNVSDLNPVKIPITSYKDTSMFKVIQKKNKADYLLGIAQ